ncbi:preprotein translocase subunit SecY [Iocasia frigidifontis]|uniref:Protein translocase subunit SecY n=1 Tax=Iocasia fonsfrigidae TaxID=2682810 RepID=A0A8A7KN59_9FIRM|nr:preprotein translocase subunit SecY [Iocasia fonsfrigidae]QTL99282.1 preprotein translocase subunit SecY [Iocasia fonsfrigidae]
MLSALGNAFKVKELRKKILFVISMMVIYRLGAFIPVPGVNIATLREQLFGGGVGNVFDFLDLFAGGALRNFTIFAMSITPYITASIILQLLTGVIPALKKLQQEGNEGKKKMTQYTRYGTIVLALIQGYGITMYVKPAVEDPNFFNLFLIVISLTAGTAFLMWLGEQITDKGIGNGISIIIFTSIISRFPGDIWQTLKLVRAGSISILNVLIFAVLALVIIAGIIFIQQGERRIPVQYSKRIVGRRVYGGRNTHIPLKINQAGVIPVIFASSVLMFPTVIAQVLPFGWAQGLADILAPGQPFYLFLYALMIFFFTYFWTAFTFDPEDVAENMKKYGGFIPGIRPGKATVNYLERVVLRVTLAGAMFLTFIALLPFIIRPLTGVAISFGGTSLLIMTGVALQTMQQIESHLLMRHYEGFMK